MKKIQENITTNLGQKTIFLQVPKALTKDKNGLAGLHQNENSILY